jgi:hypothetical protein
MALVRKLKRILTKAFPPPDKVSLRDHHGLIGIVTSTRFRNMDTMARQDVLQEVLEEHDLSAEEKRQILILVAVTPEEEAAHTAVD